MSERGAPKGKPSSPCEAATAAQLTDLDDDGPGHSPPTLLAAVGYDPPPACQWSMPRSGCLDSPAVIGDFQAKQAQAARP
jgi:hypothetical protein